MMIARKICNTKAHREERSRFLLNVFFIFLAVTFFLPFSVYADPLPTDGTFVAGSGQIAVSGQTMTVDQASQQAIAQWQSFSIGQGYTVNFNQPNSASVILNRVTGQDPSSIFGSLNANGQVFLVNPNGILFSPTSSVNAAGMVASTLNISNEDFLNGNYKFSGPGASVVAQGAISAPGGYVVLLGSHVENSGAISAPLGTIALAAGNKVTIGLDPQGMMSVAVDEPVAQNATGASDAVKNSGTLSADGGTVILTAKTLNGIFDHAINNTGIIHAGSLQNKNGVIRLVAAGATITNTGSVTSNIIQITTDASFRNDQGGQIAALLAQGIANTGNITITANDMIQDGMVTAADTVAIAVAESIRAGLPVNLNPDSAIQANRIILSGRQFGSEAVPLKLQADKISITKTDGDINILESTGIGTSVLLRGPPEGCLAILYNKEADLNLDAEKIVLTGPDPIYFFGNITFSNLECTVPSKEIYFEAGKTYTILGDLTLIGGYGELLKLRSSVDGQQWNIDPRGSRNLEFISVKDSNNINSQEIVAIRSNKEENCTFWDPTTTWTGNGANNNWSTGGNWDTGVAPPAGNDVSFPGIGANGNKNATVDAGFAGTINSLSITGYTGTITLSRSLTITNGFTQSSGTFTPGGNAVNVGGNFTRTGGTWTTGTSTLTMSGASAVLSANGATIYRLTTSGASITVNTTDVTISNLLTVNNGSTLAISSGRTVTMSNGSTTTINAAGTISGAGTLILVRTAGQALSTTGTLSSVVRFDANGGNISPVPARTYGGDVQFYNNTANARTITLGAGTFNFQGNVYLLSNAGGNISLIGATNNPTVNISGNLDYTGTGAGTETFSTGTGTWTISGNVDVSGGTAPTITAGNTFVFNASSGTQTFNSGAATFRTVTKTNGGTLQLTAALTVNTALNINAGTFDPNGFLVTGSGAADTLSVTGTILVPTTTFALSYTSFNTRTLNAGSAVNYNRAGNQTVDNSLAYKNLIISGSGTKTLAGVASIANGGTLTLSGGTFATGTNLSMASTSSIAISGGSMTGTLQGAGVYDVAYTGNSKTTGAELSGSGLRNITINLADAAQTVTLDQNRSPDGDLNIAVGILDLSTFTINRSAAGGTLTVANGATLKIGGTNTMPSNYSTHSLGATSTVEYSGAAQSVSAETYGNLTTSGSLTKTLAGAVIIQGSLTIGTGTTLDVSASNFGISVAGDWLNSGAFTAQAGTVTFNGSGAQTIKTNNNNFYSVTLSNNTINLQAAGGHLTIGGNLKISNGQNPVITTNDQNFTVNGNTDGTDGWAAETLTIDAGTGAVTFNGYVHGQGGGQNSSGLADVTLTNAGTVNFNGTVRITGALTQTNAATGTTTFNAAVSVGSADLKGTTININSSFAAASGDIDITASDLIDIDAFASLTNNFSTGNIYLAVNNVNTNAGAAEIDVDGSITTIGGNITIVATNTSVVSSTNTTYNDSSSRYAYLYINNDITSGSGNITLSAVNIVNMTINGSSNIATYNDGSSNYARISIDSGIISTLGTISIEASNTVTRVISATSIDATNFYDYSYNYAELYAYGEIDASAGSGDVSLTATNTVDNTVDGGAYIYYIDDQSQNYAYTYLNNSNGILTDTGAITLTAENNFTRDVTADTIYELDDFTMSCAYLEVQSTPISSASGNITASATNTVDLDTTTTTNDLISGYSLEFYYAGYENYAEVYIWNGSWTATPMAGAIDIDAANIFTEDVTANAVGYTYIYDYYDWTNSYNYAYVYVYDNLDVSAGLGTVDVTAANSVTRTISVVSLDYLEDYSYNYTYLEVYPITASTGTITVLSDNDVTMTVTATDGLGNGWITYYDDEPYNYAQVYLDDTISTAGAVDVDADNSVTRNITTDYFGNNYYYDYSYNYAELYAYGEIDASAGSGDVSLTATNTVDNTVDGGTYIYYIDDQSQNYAYTYLNNSNGILTDTGAITLTAENNFTRDVTADTIGDFDDYSSSYAQIDIDLSGGNLFSSGDLVLDATNTITKNNVFNDYSSNYSIIDIDNTTIDVAGISTVAAEDITFNSGFNWILDNALTVNGDLSINGTLDATAADVDINGSIDISGGTLTAPTTGKTFTVSGDWSNSGTFNAGSGTVIFDGAGVQAMSGTSVTTFNDLTLSGSGAKFIKGDTIISGKLSIAATAQADLEAGSTINANTLALGGIDQSAGSWGSTTSSATHTDDTYFTATTGMLNVATGVGYTISGTVYTDLGITAIPDGATITILVNGVSQGSITTTGGAYSLSGVNFVDGDALLVYIDGNIVQGTTVTTANAGDLSGIDVYGNTVIARYENAGPITNTTLANALGGFSDPDILYSMSGSDAITNTGADFIIWSGCTYAPGGNLTTNSFTIQAGATYQNSGNTTTISGDYTNQGSLSTPATGIFDFNGSGTQTLISGGTGTGYRFNNLRHSGSGTLKISTNPVRVNGNLTNSNGTFDASGRNLDVNGNLIISGGTFIAPSGARTLNVAGNFNNTATFTSGTGTVNLSGSGFIKSSGSSFNNLTVSGSYWLSDALTATSDLVVTGSLDANGKNISEGGNWDFTSLSNLNNVTLTGAGNTITSGGNAFANNLTITGNYTLNDALVVTNNLITNAGSLDANFQDITEGGNWNFNNLSNLANVTLNGAGKTIDSSGTAFAQDLTINGSYTLDDKLTVTGDMIVNGSLDANNKDISEGGNWSFSGLTNLDAVILTGAGNTITSSGNTFSGNLRIAGNYSLADDLEVAGNLRIAAGAALDANNCVITIGGDFLGLGNLTQGSGALNIAGDWTNTGTFTVGTGGVNYNGAGDQTVGAVTYNDVTFSGSGNKTISAGTAINGNLSISGTAVADLTAGVNISVNSLTLGGTNKASGTWGSSGSGAAHQNDSYFTATTGILTVATGPIPTVSAPTSSLDPSTYGDAVTFTVTVTGPGGTPTGTVTFKDGATTIGTGTLVGGVATYTTTASQLSAGSHSITAEYSGDDNFDPAASGATTQTVNKKALTVTGITANNKFYDGNTTAILNTGAAALSGVVAGDTVTLNTAGATGTFSDPDIGAGKIVTISGLTIGGADAGNYTVTQPTTTANIVSTTAALNWTGAVSNAWNVAGNWDLGVVPVATSNVTLSASANDPILSGAITLSSLTINSGTLDTAGNTITVTNTFENKGSVVASTGDIDITAGNIITGTMTNSSATSDIILTAKAGDISVTGTLTSNNGGVSLTSDNGSITAVGAGPHIVANADSYLSAPNGAVSPSGDPLNVNIAGKLLINVSNSTVSIPTRETYGNIIGTITSSLGIPTLVPSSFPLPLLPPGFVYYNGTQIWPTTNPVILQEFASASTDSLKDRFWETLVNTRLVSVDRATPQFYAYHPLTETDESAFEKIELDADAYEFIENKIELKKELGPYFEEFDQKKKKAKGTIS